jgi:hypothetical protein
MLTYALPCGRGCRVPHLYAYQRRRQRPIASRTELIARDADPAAPLRIYP